MNESFMAALRYIFVLTAILIIVAYWAGASKVLSTSFQGINSLGLTFSGRNQQGNFAAYPTGGPTS